MTAPAAPTPSVPTSAETAVDAWWDRPRTQPLAEDQPIPGLRRRLGIERYGTPLQAHNGRDALRDAYEEALDLANYLRQAMEERKAPTPASPTRAQAYRAEAEVRAGEVPVISREFIEASRSRAARWHGEKPWTTAEWIMATMGELGEMAEHACLPFPSFDDSIADRVLPLVMNLGMACNAAKKLLRARDGVATKADTEDQVLGLRAAVNTLLARVELLKRDLKTNSSMWREPAKGLTVDSPEAFAIEAADVLAYLVLAVDSVAGADLNTASVSKFNEVSERYGFPERIGAAPTPKGSVRAAWAEYELDYAPVVKQ